MMDNVSISTGITGDEKTNPPHFAYEGGVGLMSDIVGSLQFWRQKSSFKEIFIRVTELNH